ncbi:murein hydrolase activator EnvC [Dysgonomonas sp. 511]|uniref:murein hydrolase activator EnvC family protein n=1 Tax=Dysgonomonas sp. 511 TaxID=2302930 RepID=UPI0013D89DDA|nr:peptidoglycan DD-metalloendopeptidase family protein [Dysgonomonas sp. 511]NDV79280.1 hypothetical protein [Dysgonomonas sp. 511]
MRTIAFSLLLLISISSFAQDARIKELERQRKEALREISNTTRLLAETQKNTATLIDRVKLIANQIFSRQKVLNLLEQEIEGLKSEEIRIEAEIGKLQIELKEQQDSYAKAVEGVLKNRQNESQLLFILSGKSFTESYRRLRYLQNYSQWRKEKANEIIEKNNQLKEKKIALAKAQKEKTTLLSQRITEQANLKKEEKNYKVEVAEAQSKQSTLQKILTQRQQQANNLNKEIARLIAEEVARQQREEERLAAEHEKAERKASPSSTPSPRATNKKAATPRNIALSKNFAANKGKLPYPISGNYAIVSRFGNQSKNIWKIEIPNNGIDIRSQAGAEAKAVFDGEITRIVAMPGYNTCIVVCHGDYFTLYANIDQLYVRQGDKVKTGQALGRLYSEPDTKHAQIHFELWRKTQMLNPELWLR